MRHHYKFGVVLLTLLMIMPMNMAARRKKTVYLKTETGATAYYRGEVDDQDQPAGQGEFVVEAGNAGYACRGTEVMHLTGMFSRSGVSNAILILNTQPALEFRGLLSYVMLGGHIEPETVAADLQTYEQRLASHLEKRNKLQRAEGFLSAQEREQKLNQVEQEAIALKREHAKLLAQASAAENPADRVYSILQFTLKQGTLKMSKWNWADGSEQSSALYSIDTKYPVQFNLVANNAYLSFLGDIIARNKTLEQKITGDVVGGTYVEEIRLFDVTPVETLLPAVTPKSSDPNKELTTAGDPFFSMGFQRTVLSNFLRGRRKVDGHDQTISIGKTGVAVMTPDLNQNETLPLGEVDTSVPFIELNADGIFIVENFGPRGVEQRHQLFQKQQQPLYDEPEEEEEPEPAPVPAPEVTVPQPPQPNPNDQMSLLRKNLSLNIMTERSVMGPWQVASGNARSTWNFRTDKTMSFTATDKVRRTWTMDNHLITITHEGMSNPSILEVLSFVPDTMELRDTAGTVFSLYRDTSMMTPEELAVYEAATSSFNDRMRVMTGEIPEPAPEAIPAVVEEAIPAVIPEAVPSVTPAAVDESPQPAATSSGNVGVQPGLSDEELRQRTQSMKLPIPVLK